MLRPGLGTRKSDGLESNHPSQIRTQTSARHVKSLQASTSTFSKVHDPVLILTIQPASLAAELVDLGHRALASNGAADLHAWSLLVVAVLYLE